MAKKAKVPELITAVCYLRKSTKGKLKDGKERQINLLHSRKRNYRIGQGTLRDSAVVRG